MSTEFSNVYEDRVRADAYAELTFPGTYYLAFRDLPAIIRAHVAGGSALDFGCGAGRSTRFLRSLGFDVVGVDVSAPMVEQARRRDPQGDYRVVSEGGIDALVPGSFDLVLSAFTFDNVPTLESKVALFRSLRRLVRDQGCIVNLVSTPDIYVNEWASFSTRAFPGNRSACSGDTVRIVMLDVGDSRPVEDILCTDADYLEVCARAGLTVRGTWRPLGLPTDPCTWVSESTVAPWAIYALQPSG